MRDTVLAGLIRPKPEPISRPPNCRLFHHQQLRKRTRSKLTQNGSETALRARLLRARKQVDDFATTSSLPGGFAGAFWEGSLGALVGVSVNYRSSFEWWGSATGGAIGASECWFRGEVLISSYVEYWRTEVLRSSGV